MSHEPPEPSVPLGPEAFGIESQGPEMVAHAGGRVILVTLP
jgi:hypothetical protein